MIYKAEDLWNKDSPYLEHKFGFKYILKLPVGKTFRYFYSQAQINAYKAKKMVNKVAKNLFGQKISTRSQKYTKPNETTYQKKPENTNEQGGVDSNGYKYVAKVNVGGKVRYFYSEEEYAAYKSRQFYQNDRNEPDFMKGYKETDSPRTAEEDAVSVNPNILEAKDGTFNYSKNMDYTNNCAECTMVYEMRRRGYDVEYNTKFNISGADMRSDMNSVLKYNTQLRFSYCFEKPTTYSFRHTPKTEEFKSFMKKKFPPNSRGDISVQWKGIKGGHSMVWETDSRGNVTIRDAQLSGTGMPTIHDPTYLFKRSRDVRVTRLDNLKPKKNIKKIIQNKSTSDQKAFRGQEIYMNKPGATFKTYSKSEMYKKFNNTGV